MKVGDKVVITGRHLSSSTTIARETATQLVTRTGLRFRKSDLRGIGHSDHIRPMSDGEAGNWDDWEEASRVSRGLSRRCQEMAAHVAHYRSRGDDPLDPLPIDLAPLEAALADLERRLGIG